MTVFVNQLTTFFSGPAKPIFRGMTTLFLGSGVSRAIAAASLPILSRVYSPQDFGMLSVFMAVTAFLMPIATLRFTVAIPLPKTDAMAANLFVLTNVLATIVFITAAFSLWFFGEALLVWLSAESIAHLWWLLGLSVFAGAAFESLSMWATRKKNYTAIARTEVFGAGTGAVAKIGLGMLAFKPMGLIFGQLLSQTVGLVSLLATFRDDFRRNARYVTKKRMAACAVRYRSFPIFRLPSQFLLVFSIQAPIIFTARYYDARTTGQLGIAFTVLALPLSLLGGTISKAYYAEIAGYGRREHDVLRSVTIDVMKKLLLFSITPALVLFFFGQDVFVWLLGKEWELAGQFAAALSVFLIAQFVSTPIMNLFNVLDLQMVFLWVNLVRAFFITVIFVVAAYLEISAYTAVVMLSLVLTMHYLGVTIYALSKLQTPAGRKIESE